MRGRGQEGRRAKAAVASGSTPTSSTLARRRCALLLFLNQLPYLYWPPVWEDSLSSFCASCAGRSGPLFLCPPSCRSPAQQPLSVLRDRPSERQGSWTDFIYPILLGPDSRWSVLLVPGEPRRQERSAVCGPI